MSRPLIAIPQGITPGEAVAVAFASVDAAHCAADAVAAGEALQ